MLVQTISTWTVLDLDLDYPACKSHYRAVTSQRHASSMTSLLLFVPSWCVAECVLLSSSQFPFSAFFYSLDVFSLFHRRLKKNNYRFKNIWSPPGIEPRTTCLTQKHLCVKQAVLGSIPGGNQILLILYCLKKAFERDHLLHFVFLICILVGSVCSFSNLQRLSG